jgi:hypothetical protein
MYPKLVALTVMIALLGAGMLVLRQHRLELASRAASTHARIIQARHELWQAQTRAADQINPLALQRRIDQSELALEPIKPDGPASSVAANQPPR